MPSKAGEITAPAARWEELIAFLDFPLEIRKIIYTTNIIENLNGKIRKYTIIFGASLLVAYFFE